MPAGAWFRLALAATDLGFALAEPRGADVKVVCAAALHAAADRDAGALLVHTGQIAVDDAGEVFVHILFRPGALLEVEVAAPTSTPCLPGWVSGCCG